MARSLTRSACFYLAAVVAAAQLPAAGDVEVICHPNDAAECYPKIFQATDDFQPVRPGQDVPSGLHVRLNAYTGEKEAKINVPSEQDPALAGLPVESAVIPVSPEAVQDSADLHIPRGAPAYEAVGKVKEPTGPEAYEFGSALAVVRKVRVAGTMGNFYDALDKLGELSHDLYYGLKIAQDLEVLGSLFCLMTERAATPVDAAGLGAPRALLAARTVSAAVQNNPVALKAVEQNWPALMAMTCAGGGKKLPLGPLFFSTIRPDMGSAAADREASLTRAKLSAIKGLIKSPLIRQDFLEKGAMGEVLRVLLIKDGRFGDAQAKAANLVTDTFLDESMGAVLGLWPGKANVDSCDYTAPDFSDGCWGLWVRRLAEGNKADPSHWSLGLSRMLAEQSGGPRVEEEQRVYDEL